MSVYVDNMSAQYGRMKMCHMVADTLEELHQMADSIGVKRKWFQGPPAHKFPHYDVGLSKKRHAIAAGAIQITAQEAVYYAAKLRFEFCREHMPAMANEAQTEMEKLFEVIERKRNEKL